MVNTNNIILATDSYKLNHWNQYPHDTEAVYSYFESRPGAEFPYTVFFGLQYLLEKYLDGPVVTQDAIDEAAELAEAHFGNPNYFNLEGWQHIVDHHMGRLPLEIKAVPEGTVIPTGNVLMTVENTCPKCYWLTNAVESILTHVWYSSTIATLSRSTKEMIAGHLDATADNRDGLPFMLHDFGYRGASSHESAGIGGAGHLVNFLGTDTLPAMSVARKHYGAVLDDLAFSVAATEHSVMTARGEEGEMEVVDQLLDEYPTGILSVVADSYDIYRFVKTIGSDFRERILAREGTFVVRPDSVTEDHPYPSALTVWIAESLWKDFGGTINTKGMKVLDPNVRILWGDGIDPHGIDKILSLLQLHGFSAENMVFGMGGGLLQKVNRDTQRFAFKSSAQKRNGEWHDIFKRPLDRSKASKRGRLKLINIQGQPSTVAESYEWNAEDQLETVFKNGTLRSETDFAAIRARAALDTALAIA